MIKSVLDMIIHVRANDYTTKENRQKILFLFFYGTLLMYKYVLEWKIVECKSVCNS